MLRPPYSRYSRLYVYHLDLQEVPVVVDPDFIGTWQEGETIVLFFHQPKDDFVKNICSDYACEIVYQADLDYLDWEAGVEISPFSVGDLTVAPIWDAVPAQIRLDPSVIFGSGFHPTTRLCLESLVRIIDLSPANSINKVYDLGCGTGLLSIAAATKGAANVLAVDYNGLACQVATANAELNDLQQHVECQQLDLLEASPDTHGVDLVMANLHHELLLELFQRPSFWQARYYILSGFFVAREEEMLCALPIDSVRFVARHSESKWGIWVLEHREVNSGLSPLRDWK